MKKVQNTLEMHVQPLHQNIYLFACLGFNSNFYLGPFIIHLMHRVLEMQLFC